MQSSTAEFDTLLRKEHTACSKVEVTRGGSQTILATTEVDGVLQLLDGTITIDRSATTRRSASLRFSDVGGPVAVPVRMTTLTEAEWFNPLSYFEFRPYRGIIRASDGVKEYMPQGVFYLSEVDITEDADGVTLDCRLEDRSTIISENPWRTPYNIAAGVNYATAIQNIITNRAGTKFTPVFNFEVTTFTTPSMTFAVNEDPWENCQKLAEACGMVLFFGVSGELILRVAKDPASSAISAVFNTAADSIRVAPLSRNLDRKTARSGVIVRGSAPWLIVPVSAEVWDDDPLSSTYRMGPLGELPEIIDDAAVTNTAMASASAQGKFNQIVGILEAITFSSIVDPRLDGGDVIEITSSMSGVAGRYVLENLDLPLQADTAMSGKTRRRRRQ